MLLLFFTLFTTLTVAGRCRIRCLNTTISSLPKKLYCAAVLLIPLYTAAQQPDSVRTAVDSLKIIADTTAKRSNQGQKVTLVSGIVTEALTGKPLSFISVKFAGTNSGAVTDSVGHFLLSRPGLYYKVTFSYVGYQPVTRTIKAGQANTVQVSMRGSPNQLKEVAIKSTRKVKYRNKGNPAVELIQQVIDHKAQNRMESADYLQYDLYERTGFSFFHISDKLVRMFNRYKFMLDSSQVIHGEKQRSLPVFFSEKLSENYYRKNPSKNIQVLKAQKDLNILKFIDTAGLSVYIKRLYGNNIDIYDNNIFIITNQFLSPIADHAPAFYKFFITDTIKSGNEKLVEISFTPRNKGDLLFEGKLLVTQDGRYAVQSCDLNVNKQININFMRSLQVRLDFERYQDGRYYLKKSDVKADFGLLKEKGLAVFGERSVMFSNYKLNKPMPQDFYEGKSEQQAADTHQSDSAFWAGNRPDSLTAGQAKAYADVKRLEKMHSFKRDTWWAATLTGGYANTGPVQIGPLGSSYAYDTQEGSRFQVGGRTTTSLSKDIYLGGFVAYGIRDKIFKYNPAIYFSLNKTPFYRFPNDYFKLSYMYDVNVPGYNYAITNAQTALTSFSTGKTDYWIYSRIFAVDYVKDFESHFSYDVTFKTWSQQAAGTLLFQMNDAVGGLVNKLNTTEAGISLRYAPHEQILQGTQYRRTIYSKYPIYNFRLTHDFNGLFNGEYAFTKFTGSVYKRFYLSQLGTTDITVLGGYLAGKVPFPLLFISAANQSISYSPEGYNNMNYLEFVSDHYTGIDLTQSFNGFFLNKIPLIEHLKWREF
ncbi:MAG TPA: DUF5686 family protein, partial [Mucilaginibacter sp.]